MPTNELLMQLHPDQIKILVQTWRKHAVHTMNPHDVSEALRIQDVARKKSAAYAAVVGFVIQQNPNLTLADEVPITNAGKQAQFDRKEYFCQIFNKQKNKTKTSVRKEMI
jgi:conjugal transfer pilus assembly protein TraF